MIMVLTLRDSAPLIPLGLLGSYINVRNMIRLPKFKYVVVGREVRAAALTTYVA